MAHLPGPVIVTAPVAETVQAPAADEASTEYTRPGAEAVWAAGTPGATATAAAAGREP
jgi:hypothetical protein